MVLFVATMFAAAGCSSNKAVTVRYFPLANAPIIDPGRHRVGTRMVYCILGVDNTGSNAADFMFDVRRLTVKEPNVINQLQGYWMLANTQVNKGTKTTTLGTLVIDAMDPEAPDQGWVPLSYDAVPGDEVVMVEQPSRPAPVFHDTGLPPPGDMPRCPAGPMP